MLSLSSILRFQAPGPACEPPAFGKFRGSAEGGLSRYPLLYNAIRLIEREEPGAARRPLGRQGQFLVIVGSYIRSACLTRPAEPRHALTSQLVSVETGTPPHDRESAARRSIRVWVYLSTTKSAGHETGNPEQRCRHPSRWFRCRVKTPPGSGRVRSARAGAGRRSVF